ncbi:ATP-dependent Clp protease ATP-binding subunit ClpX [Vibrio breoganii]
MSNPKTCSFCGKDCSANPETKVVATSTVAICSDCVTLCSETLEQDKAVVTRSGATSHQVIESDLTPIGVFEKLNERVIGHDLAKKRLSVALCNHIKRVNSCFDADQSEQLEKSNVLIVGNTGTGKTLLARTLGEIANLPFIIADCSSLTANGYEGENANNIIQRLVDKAGGDIGKAEFGIVYLDEVCKIRAQKGSGADVGGEGVQQALLKLIEGTEIELGRSNRERTSVSDHSSITKGFVDTSNILFIAGGSFAGIEEIAKDTTRNEMGFGASDLQDPSKRASDVSKYITFENLTKYGMIPEMLGRFPTLAPLKQLTHADIVRIMTEPKNSVLSQYKKLFEMDGLELSIEDGFIDEVAKHVLTRKTGARAARGVLEDCLLDVMFDPSKHKGKKIVLDKAFYDKATSVTTATS